MQRYFRRLLFWNKPANDNIIYLAAIKYAFAQADEILPKINALKQYYVRKQDLFYFRLCSCDVAYSSAQ